MVYQHILVAVDLSEDSNIITQKAARLAQALNATLSLIHIDVDYADVYTGLIDINLAEMHERAENEAQIALHQLAVDANYPVAHTLVGSGDLTEEICGAIKNMDIDLVICGHHQDFWSKILSSTRQLIRRTPIDLLMIPLK